MYTQIQLGGEKRPEIERLEVYREYVLGKHLRQAVKRKERKQRDVEGGNEGRFESERGGSSEKKHHSELCSMQTNKIGRLERRSEGRNRGESRKEKGG